MSAFFAMGGYAAYIWPAYGISLLGLAGAIALTMRAYGRAKALLADLEREGPA
ncbi:MAG TPA: heme exporter protein CcmD [Rhizomicrobium sp.]|jgi:heme exporter protein D